MITRAKKVDKSALDCLKKWSKKYKVIFLGFKKKMTMMMMITPHCRLKIKGVHFFVCTSPLVSVLLYKRHIFDYQKKGSSSVEQLWCQIYVYRYIHCPRMHCTLSTNKIRKSTESPSTISWLYVYCIINIHKYCIKMVWRAHRRNVKTLIWLLLGIY